MEALGEADQARCLVTGCSSGIGRATALALADAGAYVVATARDIDSIAGLAAQGLTVATLDVTDDAIMVRRVLAAAEPLDVVVNNAGYGLEVPSRRSRTTSSWRSTTPTSLACGGSAAPCCPECALVGVARSSTSRRSVGSALFPGIGAYRSSKFAVEGLTWTLHLEVAHFGIRVISVPARPRRNGFRHAFLQASARDRPSRSVCGDAPRSRTFVRAHVADGPLTRGGCRRDHRRAEEGVWPAASAHRRRRRADDRGCSKRAKKLTRASSSNSSGSTGSLGRPRRERPPSRRPVGTTARAGRGWGSAVLLTRSAISTTWLESNRRPSDRSRSTSRGYGLRAVWSDEVPTNLPRRLTRSPIHLFGLLYGHPDDFAPTRARQTAIIDEAELLVDYEAAPLGFTAARDGRSTFRGARSRGGSR